MNMSDLLATVLLLALFGAVVAAVLALFLVVAGIV